jgi:hypothetical protein
LFQVFLPATAKDFLPPQGLTAHRRARRKLMHNFLVVTDAVSAYPQIN